MNMTPLISGFFISKGEKMAERENTGNTIPSNALKDLNDNTIILDEWTNSKLDYTQDRFGVKFKTRYKILNDLQASVNSIQSGSFLPISGGTLTGPVTGTDFTGNNITAKTSLTVGSAKATYSTTGLNFDKPLLINNVGVLKKGDGGLLSKLSPSDYLDPNSPLGSGFYTSNKTKYPNAPYEYTGLFNISTSSGGYAQIAMDLVSNSMSARTQAGGVVRGWVDLITTANISSYQSGLGINQTWQDVTSSRAVGTVYTNTTGKPIFISYVLQTQGGNTRLYVNDILVASNSTGTLLFSTFTAVIPPLSTYKVTGGSLEVATELR